MAGFKLSDDEIIKRKLMFDGEGMGDDRRLNLLIKQFCIWTNQLGRKDITQEDKDLNYERILIFLNEIEFSINKSEVIKQMCTNELKEYDAKFINIEQDIENSKAELSNLKDKLVEAKAERKNKSEANAICTLIEEFPSRDETNNKLFQVNDEIGTLERATVNLKNRLENWKKQFESVIKSTNDLNNLLEQDTEGEIIDADKEDEEPMEGVAEDGDKKS